jgi:hypothetical protein
VITEIKPLVIKMAKTATGRKPMLSTEQKDRDDRPAMNSVLFVSEESRRAMSGWPLELQALFNPRVDRELAERIEAEKRAARRTGRDDDALPF